MLTLQFGHTRDARRTRMLREIRKLKEGGVNRIYILVPEPTTFAMSRDICKALGNEKSNVGLEVLGFERLLRRIHSDCGNIAEYMDDGGRMLAMTLAAEKSASSLTVFRSMATRPEFLESLLSTYSTFRLHNVTSEKLLSTSEETESTVLKNKLRDLGTIFSQYEAICEESKADPADELDGILPVLTDNGWARGSAWFIDGFTDFPAQQMAVIREIIRQSVYTMVTLPAASLHDEMPCHSLALYTAGELEKNAAEDNIECEAVCATDEDKMPAALTYLQNNLCDNTPAADSRIANAGKVIKLFCDQSPYQECQHIIGTMMKALRKGYRYRDMSVVLCDYERYAPIMATVCRRYGIPAYFASQKDEVAKKPVMISVFSALNAATRGMQKEDVLQYIKSGMTSLSEECIDKLENYVRTWNIHGKGWEPSDASGWTMHPDGYGREFTDEDISMLEAINRYRTVAVQPLLDLRTRLNAGKTIADHIMSVYDFLEGVGFTDYLQDIVDTLMADGKEQLATRRSPKSSTTPWSKCITPSVPSSGVRGIS